MQISQIYLSDSPEAPPPYIQNCVKSIKALYPQWEHVLYDQNTLREFLVECFDGDVVRAYDKLNPYAYKADLGRYCLLYEKGGWYFDAAVRVLNPISMNDEVETLAFREEQLHSGTNWACSNSVLYAKAGSSIFRMAIDRVLEHCSREHYGITPLCPTGPTLLGGAFAAHGADKSHQFGDLIRLTPLRPMLNPAFVMPSGLILAMGKPGEGGDMTQLGAKGTNNYNDFYYTKTVYRQ